MGRYSVGEGVMAENSEISWCDHTFNPVVGCTKVSPACDNCYAESWAKRTGQSGLWNGERRVTTDANWRKVTKWNERAGEFRAEHGRRQRVFCASLADVFDNQWQEEWRTALWFLIEQCPGLDFLLLTKRPQNIKKMLPADWADGYPNVWLGTTVENQEEADRRIPHLLAVPATIKFLSCEPLLGPIRFSDVPGFNRVSLSLRNWWVIAGGESGPKARPPMISWVRSLRDQCAIAGVPFHFKQWGEYTPDDPASNHTAMRRVGKAKAGALLDGREWREFPQG